MLFRSRPRAPPPPSPPPRFFCALAVVGKAQYQGVIDELHACRDPPLDDLARNWQVGARAGARAGAGARARGRP